MTGMFTFDCGGSIVVAPEPTTRFPLLNRAATGAEFSVSTRYPPVLAVATVSARVDQAFRCNFRQGTLMIDPRVWMGIENRVILGIGAV
jgi:hypothetical protein